MPDTPGPAPAPIPAEPALPRPAGRGVTGTLRVLVVAALLLAVVVPVRTYLVGPVRVASGSMTPTLLAGDVVLVDRTRVALTDVRRGDLVTFRAPGTGDETLKRVVALPGDTVATIDAVLHVNDSPVHEPYVDFSEWDGMFTARVTVPDGAVYVLGDNRLSSIDSRDFGPVPLDALDGQVLVRLWPPVRVGGEQPQPPR